MWLPMVDALRVLQGAEEAKVLQKQLASCQRDLSYVWGKVGDKDHTIAAYIAADSISNHKIELIKDQLANANTAAKTKQEQVDKLTLVVADRDKKITKLTNGKRTVGIAAVILIIGALFIKH